MNSDCPTRQKKTAKKNENKITVIGGGLAGCEAAYQIARRGIDVELLEMKPSKKQRRIKAII